MSRITTKRVSAPPDDFLVYLDGEPVLRVPLPNGVGDPTVELDGNRIIVKDVGTEWVREPGGIIGFYEF